MSLTKAYIELVESSGSTPPSTTGSGTRIEFQFNPKEIKVTKAARWKPAGPNTNGEITPAEYKGPEPTEMTLEMFLDATDKENGDVSTEVQKLFDACAPTPSSKSRDMPLPAFAIFGWDRVYFRGYIENVTATYTLFRETGKPVRASCSIKLTETPGGQPRQNPTSGGRGAQGWVQLVSGDSLASIAYREFGDPTLWRAIADANGIDDPLRVRPGVELLVPAAVDAIYYR